MPEAQKSAALPGVMPDRLPENARPPEDFNPIAVAKDLLRVTRAGLRALVAAMTAVLQPLQDDGVIDSYLVFFPLLVLLDKNPSSLSDAELQEIHNAQATRTVDSVVTIQYAGAIHRLNITLKFE